MRPLLLSLLVLTACPAQKVELAGKATATARTNAPAKPSPVVPLAGTATAHAKAR